MAIIVTHFGTGLQTQRLKDSPSRLTTFTTTYGQSAVNLLAQLSTVAVLALLARTLSAGALGRELMVLSLATGVVSLTEFGSNARAVRRVASGESSTERVFRESLGKSLITGLVTFLAAVVVFLVLPDRRTPTLLLVPAYATMVQQAQGVQAQLRAQLRSWTATLLVVSDKGAGLILVVLFLWLGTLSGATFWLALLSGTTLATFLGIAALRPPLRAGIPANPYQGGIGFGIASLATGLQPLDVFAIGACGGEALAGTYGAVSRWTTPVLLVGTMAAQIEAPRMAQGSLDVAMQRLQICLLAVLPASLALLLAVPLAGLFVRTILGTGYEASTPVLQLLMLGVSFGAFASPMMTFLQNRHRERRVALILGLIVIGQIVFTAAAAGTRSTVLVAACVALTHISLATCLAVSIFGAAKGEES